MESLSSKLRRKSARLVTALLVCVGVTLSATSQEASPDARDVASLKTGTQAFLEHLARREYGAAARNLFHYPPGYSPSERSKDEEGVAFSLRVIQETFGEPLSASELTGTARWISVGAGGGDLPYWKAHPVDVPVRLSVTYSNVGPGYMMLNFVHLGESWQLRSVEFALPPSEPNGALLRRITNALAERLRLDKPAPKKDVSS